MIHRPILMSLLGWTTIIFYGFGFVTVLIVWDSQSLAMSAGSWAPKRSEIHLRRNGGRRRRRRLP